ncbi:MAG: MASE1 domain-containing protein [Archangium sp.]|nr:MASE1 domain-containing protein [Archangium sp.]
MPTTRPRSPAATALVALLLASAYAITGLLGMQLAAQPGNVTPVWVPAGLALAALITFGRGVWPGITLGSFILNVIVFPGPESLPKRLLGALAISVSSTLGLLLTHWLSERSSRRDLLGRPSTLAAFWAWVAAGCAVNATGGLLFTALLGGLPMSGFPSFWLTWWLGDTLGILLLAPLVLGEGTPREFRPLEWAATLVLTLCACQLVFGVPVTSLHNSEFPLAWTVSLGVVWAGARLGGPAVTVQTLLIYTLMSWGTLTGHGPFARWPRELALLLNDALLVALIITGQLLASLAALARSQQAALERERASLEVRVAERTSQLEASSRSLLDETEARSKLTARLVEAQKQEALGRLAGGVAHDFNNLLTVVSGEAELLRSQAGYHADVYDGAGAILAAAHRAGELTRQLLAVARRQPTAPRHVDLQATLSTNRRLLRPLFPESVTLDVTCTEPCSVNMDPTLLDQIILNLAINARDAITGPGQVKVEATPHVLEESAAAALGLQAGRWVCLSVTDDGTGIPPEVLPRIFEPFFTTKAEGRGTGLGLSTVLGIANQSRGTVKVSSHEGRTQFSVWLPASDGPAANAGVAALESRVAPRAATILVVEDEPLVRRTVVLVLERAGHRMLTAGDGEEALALLRQPGHGVELVLTDVVMPRMGGVELARAVRASYPLPVLFMSGFHESHVELAAEQVLAKPFTADQLMSAIELALRT